MSDQMRLLLDKSVIRRYFEGISALVRGQQPDDEEQQVIILIHLAHTTGNRLFISQEAANLLRAHGPLLAPVELLMFPRRVTILYPGRYFKRWARRLRERTFSREDAKVLALGCFGTDSEGQILGGGAVVTLDGAMLRKWEQDASRIAGRLSDMTDDLQAPYAWARLPKVQFPESIAPARPDTRDG